MRWRLLRLLFYLRRWSLAHQLLCCFLILLFFIATGRNRNSSGSHFYHFTYKKTIITQGRITDLLMLIIDFSPLSFSISHPLIHFYVCHPSIKCMYLSAFPACLLFFCLCHSLHHHKSIFQKREWKKREKSN